MKKVSAILLAMIMALSMGVTAFAATPGSITITNATRGQTYDLYKFFNAVYADVPGSNEKAVSYTIDPSNKFYDAMFGPTGTGFDYFYYNSTTHVVTQKAQNQDVINYLDSLAATVDSDVSIPATSDKVVFDGLEPGYYLIDRGTASTVTITTNMPDIKIIDKNQLPGNLFDKVIVTDGEPGVDSNVSFVGDVIDFKIPFTATNYDGDEMVLYYIIEDEKDPGLWVEFEDVEITVGGEVLTKGYYFFAGAVDSAAETGEWEYLGDWGSETKNPNNAQWYLIHYDYDKFDIIIPWVDDYTFVGNDAENTYELGFDLKENDGNTTLSEPKYGATTNVVVTYSAAVGPDAALTPVSENKATLKWEHTDGPAGGGTTETTETSTHNLGVKKVSGDDDNPLDGAIFELYKDADCTQPLYVIPVVKDGAIVDGVYILDDVDVVITGMERETVREKYAGAALTEWLEDDPNPDDDGTNRRNDLETNDKGELVVLGLKDGIYYVKETKAPDGYNKLNGATAVNVGTDDEGTYAGYTAYGELIVNNKGIELPSTGGEGTVRMITIGTVVAMAFAVLLITHKKMSVYHD